VFSNSYRNNLTKFIKEITFAHFYIIFFIFSLITGPFLPDLIVVITSLLLIINYKKVILAIKSSKVLQVLFVFWIYINFTSIFSQVPNVSFFSSITFIRFLLFIIAINLFLQNTKYKNIIFFSFLILYSALFFDSIFQILNGKNIIGIPIDGDRVSSFFGDELIMGSFVARTFPIVLYLFFETDWKNKNFIYYYLILISLFCVLVSAERTSLVMYVIILLGSFFFFKKAQIIKFISFFFIIFCISLLFRYQAFERLYSHTIKQFINNSNSTINLFSYRHELHFLAGYKIFQDHKFFGAGIKSFRYLCSKDKYSLREKRIKENKIYAKKKRRREYLLYF
jgi:O-antigen ligase